MLRYTARRLAASAAMLVALSVLMFGLLRLTPGDPVTAYMDPLAQLSEADVAALRARLGLDKPLPVQYLDWAGAVSTAISAIPRSTNARRWRACLRNARGRRCC